MTTATWPSGTTVLRTTPPATRRTERLLAATKPSIISSAKAAGSFHRRVIAVPPWQTPRPLSHFGKPVDQLQALRRVGCGGRPQLPTASDSIFLLDGEQRVAPGVRGVDEDAVDRLLLVLAGLAGRDELVGLLHGQLRDEDGRLQSRRQQRAGR